MILFKCTLKEKTQAIIEVGRDVYWCVQILSWLPTVCHSYRGRKEVQAITTSNPCSETLPDYWEIDDLEFPKTENGNKFAILFRDFLTKWPMVFPAPDHINQPGRSRCIFCLGLTAGHPQRHHGCQPHLIVKSTLLTTTENWHCYWNMPENLPQCLYRELRQNTRNSMISLQRQRHLQ